METYRCYLIVTPGLEEIAERELQRKLPVSEVQRGKGGLEVTVDLDWIVKAHLVLKVPTRILARVTTFKCRDFPKLFQKFSSFNWTPWLSHPEPQWEISATKSRLIHTGKIEETVKEALAGVLKKQPLREDWKKKDFPPQTFYIRLYDDELTLSLDLTGEALYKRGLQKIKGEAPLRENLAAAFLQDLYEDVGHLPLIDPMCGSGTFLTEALTFNTPLHLRPFAFETAPFFRGKTIPKALLSPATGLTEKAFGFDINEELLAKVRKELADDRVNFQVQDSLVSPLFPGGDFLMICNPPYGERIKVEGKRGSFLRMAWEKFINVDKPLRFGWVLPSDMDDLFGEVDGYTLRTKIHLKNGGMAVTFWVWQRTS